MQVRTNVMDVLSDGTITKIELSTDVMSVCISREEPDQNFIVENVDVEKPERMEEALSALADHLHDYCIYSIDVNGADGKKRMIRV